MNRVNLGLSLCLLLSVSLKAMDGHQKQQGAPAELPAAPIRFDDVIGGEDLDEHIRATVGYILSLHEATNGEERLYVMNHFAPHPAIAIEVLVPELGFIAPNLANDVNVEIGGLPDLSHIAPVAIPGQDDEEIINAVIPELSTTHEQIHAFLQSVKNCFGVHENQQPVNKVLEEGAVCSICTSEFGSLAADNSVRVTACCGQLICQSDVDQIDKNAYNFFKRSKDQAFRRVYSYRNGPVHWNEIKPLGVCPFCRHYPFTTRPNN